MYEEFELDVTALQQLPETEPVDQDGVQFGGGGGDQCLLLSNCLALTLVNED
ncbi:hypothetical protein A8924_4414 [Saccharopolyspora erythraea NRRL 2338]|uniref:Uncharacterized protein n=2 Tax=Saccharopolyspora erythraea TaxID=1836 RepID=A4FGX3_SACEN|nr:VenA family class IV lanthipeptide [Saccharopolyspora erythraea]EQD81705.1 hypothetical protein N599_34650 [Saccharopolyspora erythraea D]PFG97001.1 hypothetical protein A8924_4414 [Saccharopolyspora erythraea NRRL 2338]QRK87215.1 VenA family class IV lanthipeptide [Saccharopolyspora erythraea]CAM03298.1 hypothetical protein SACE_4027 [Saccharopolyspora erythraea NRRL 2338]